MIFTSFEFLVFFVVLAAAYFLSPARLGWLVLLVGSFLFYCWHNPSLLPFLLLPALATYFLALQITRGGPAPPGKRFLILGIGFASLGLVIFKYADFIGFSLFRLGSLFVKNLHYEPLNLLLPIGISFYTFRMISYLVDVYRGKLPAEKHAGYFLLYVSFFPQLLAGPIERAVQLLPELKKKAPFDLQRVCDGGKLIAWGLLKKLVIADRLAVVVDAVYGNVRAQSGPMLLIATLSYAIQIYCDFSAYSDMANGLSHMLGFKPIENFRAPYLSTSISDFWTRWHITFSSWLRDYLFLPITYAVMRRIKGERFLGVQAATWGYLPGVLFTMLLAGLWHDANWAMVAWGFWHGLFLMASHLSRGVRKRIVRLSGIRRAPILHRGIRVISTFILVSFAWIFFRANTLSDAFYVISHIFRGTFSFAGKVAGRWVFSTDANPLVDFHKIMKLEPYQFFVLAVAVLILMAVDRQSERGDFWVRLKTKPVWVRFLLYYLLVMGIFLFSALKSGPFIYFKF